ncbi:MAG: glycoside hydrolase family 2 TIM barrel-domain containing protein [Candidatus Wallacebacter cryptica]|nr:DUF4982 domain-containing protein [Bacillota bacterium]
MNQKRLFNDGWEFAKSSLDVAEPTNLEFQPIDLPHDWLVHDTLNLYENSIGWYRRKLVCETKPEHLLLYFEGVYMDSTLYVNGELVGEWKYGYSSFEHDLTDFIIEGENEILMKVVHQAPNSRWYSGAGIYRDVYLITRGSNYIPTDGTYVSIKPEDGRWRVEIDTELVLKDDAELIHTIYAQNRVMAVSKSLVKAKGGQQIDSQVLYVSDPRLWSPDEPNVYRLVSELKPAGSAQAVETIVQNVGFREIVLDPNQGLIVNGRKMKLNGVCEHHDLGALGAAFNKVALERRFKILKEMGVNAIRTAHNMPAPALMDLADKMGFFIVNEAFDMWEKRKTQYDYARFFPDWAERDVRSWVRRDRNHPSLLLWSIGNEIYDTHASERGQAITRMLRDYVREHDPKENAQVTIGSNYMAWENAQKCADILKIAGYNYAERLYQEHHEKYPDWVIYGSETSSVVQSRGIYHFPFEQQILADDDEQCSALGNSTVSWGAKSAEYCIIAERDHQFSLGQFLWTGFDYIGEPTPYRTKNSYFGQIDTATFPKDSFYIYQSAWTDYKTNPMIHIFPYWDFNPGQIIDVRVCSNAPNVELQLNGRTIGTFDIDHEHGDQLIGWWKVPYEEGELKAIAYDENDQVIATAVRRSFKDPKKIILKPDKYQLQANGTDLIFVEISMEDEDGNPVENATNRVEVEVSGAGRLLGLDNGDSTDYDQYKGVSRRLFSGKLMAIIGAKLEPGKIQVRVSSKGLPSEILEFEALPVDPSAAIGVSALMENQARPIVMGSSEEVPVRKVELHCDPDRVLTKDRKEITVQARIYPENASYQELEWSVVNDLGIPVPYAEVEADGHQAVVRALGDGKFRLRCITTNGSDKPKLISQLEFEGVGLGAVAKSPYEFVPAALYDYGEGELGSGSERSIATPLHQRAVLGFKNLDFGPDGSDEITIPIFFNSRAEVRIEIWDGVPNQEGSRKLLDDVYQKAPKWMVYQPETYRLNRRLRGPNDIYLVVYERMQIKGFEFTESPRAFAQNRAVEHDQLYGDTYTIKEDTIEGIGNNVSLVFEDMDFGDSGADKLVIYGRAPQGKNTIHISFADEDGETRQIIEFPASEEYQKLEFPIEKVTGKQTVTFIFLPGSNFDFGWFKFSN